MIKTIKKYMNDLTDEQLGRLIKMTFNETEEETDDEVVNYLHKAIFKPADDKYKRISDIRSEVAKKGGGRPRKKVQNNGKN